jgi:hypothetical protein
MKIMDDTDLSKFALVPPEFPSTVYLFSLSGNSTKLVLTHFEGRHYQPGSSPPERYESWQHCCNLIGLLAERCRETEYGKYVQLTQPQILDQYLVGAVAGGFGTTLEITWVIRGVASELGWPAREISSEVVAGKVPYCDMSGDVVMKEETVRYLRVIGSVPRTGGVRNFV